MDFRPVAFKMDNQESERVDWELAD
jgi:hypothetical protein